MNEITVVERPRRNNPRRRAARKVIKKARKGVKKAAGSVSKLQKEADAVMSRYVRIKASDAEGICECYTCGYKAHYKKMQNGHYISRYWKSRRYDERNTRVQCSMCNMWKNGDIPTFRMKLVAELGEEEVHDLERGYKEITKLTADFYLERIEYFKGKLALLEQL